MKYSIECICGWETPLVESEELIDFDLLNEHQWECEVYNDNLPPYMIPDIEERHPDTGRGK